MKRWKYGLLILMAALTLYGCGKAGQPEQKEEGVYQIYYLNAGLTKLEPRAYKAVAASDDVGGLIGELMGQMMNVPKDQDIQAPLGDKVAYKGYKSEERVLYLEFDDNYTSMKPTREILCRAALTKTMTQIDGIDYVSIYSGDQPLLNTSGSPVGFLSDSDFINNISDVNAYEKTELNLYFADESGEKLVKEKREVIHSTNTSLEKLVIEQLIMGPTKEGLNPTLPKDTKLLNVSVNDNVCYINFDAAFLNSKLEVKEYLPIYSIVNSLAEATNVNTVQIAVDGSQEVLFRESIPLNTPFERNLDYNAEEGESDGDSAEIQETGGK